MTKGGFQLISLSLLMLLPRFDFVFWPLPTPSSLRMQQPVTGLILLKVTLQTPSLVSLLVAGLYGMVCSLCVRVIKGGLMKEKFDSRKIQEEPAVSALPCFLIQIFVCRKKKIWKTEASCLIRKWKTTPSRVYKQNYSAKALFSLIRFIDGEHGTPFWGYH